MNDAGLSEQIGAQGASLMGMKCRDCGVAAVPYQAVCPACMSEAVDEVLMPSEGVVYTLTTVHAAPKKWATPYRIGYVDLSNGVRVFSHLQGGEIRIGDTVRVSTGDVGSNPDGSIIRQSVFLAVETRS